MASPKLPESLVDLLADPKRVTSAVKRERAARCVGRGWLGLTPRQNPQAVLAFADGVSEIDVHPRSPARKAEVRSGDIVEAISVPGVGRLSLDQFGALNVPARTIIGVEFYRPGACGRPGRKLAVEVKLVPWPRTRQWETRPRVAPGRRIMKPDRPRFLAEMLGYLREMIAAPSTFARAYCYLSLLILKHDNDKHRGIWASYRESAKRLGITARTVNDLALMLRWFGVVRVLQWPTPERNTNLVEICWPTRGQTVGRPSPVAPPQSNKVRRVRL